MAQTVVKKVFNVHLANLILSKQFLHPKHVLNVCPRAGVMVYEQDRKGGYRKDRNISNKQMIKDGVKEIGREVEVFLDETKEKFKGDIMLDIRHGDYEYLWKFNDHKTIETWIATSDKDNNEGASVANFHLNKNNNGIFHGTLNCTVLKDGVNTKTGYCNIRSPGNMKSFKRKVPYSFDPFNCLVLRVRGDGRPYLINIGIDRYFDVMWNDQFNYTLYTRGGPYWQTAKIPFSKFFASSKGRIQDKQYYFETHNVSFVGITQADGNDGPFSLEIDYMALLYDANHTEKFAYEMYQADPSHVGT